MGLMRVIEYGMQPRRRGNCAVLVKLNSGLSCSRKIVDYAVKNKFFDKSVTAFVNLHIFLRMSLT